MTDLTDHVAAALEAGAKAIAATHPEDWWDEAQTELDLRIGTIATLTALVGSEEVLARIGKPIGLYRLQMRNRGLVVRSTDVAMARAAVAAIIDLLSKGEN
jgi:hypothetical protein